MIAESVWYLTVGLLVLLTAVFVYIIVNSGKSAAYEGVQQRWYAFRSKWTIFLLGFGVIVTLVTLNPFPIVNQVLGLKDSTVVNVVGHAWYWALDKQEFAVGESIEFHVTSADVNHGFGIYDQELKLLTQTQAMPDYVNKVSYTFELPGTYKVLCLEYCGLAHHAMVAELSVK